jgi:xanthine dehydrogenase YagS FAD-binding subunit
MKRFVHVNAGSVAEAAAALGRFNGRARLIAGGTDLLGWMKDQSLPVYPEAVINLKTASGLDAIEPDDKGGFHLGALVTLDRIAAHPEINRLYPALAMAAGRAASPTLRTMGTLGGNLCQDIRCWYYRHPKNRFPCLRKGGGRCYAWDGDHRYHSIFGASVPKGCLAVHVSDTAPALAALGARVVTSRRTMPLEDFFAVGVMSTTVLEPDEILTRIELPPPTADMTSRFAKFALRPTIDFPLVNCAVGLTIDGDRVEAARIWLNAVHVKPYRARAAEEVIQGFAVGPDQARAVAEAAVASAEPLPGNVYLVSVARALVERTLLACRPDDRAEER